MAKKLLNKYYLKNTSAGSYVDVTTMFDGVNILAVSGMTERGKALNVYSEQWMTGETDFQIVSDSQSPTIVRENVDIEITFVVGPRYATTTTNFNAQSVYDSFVNYMCATDVWVKSAYVGKAVHCVNIDGCEPQTVNLHRGSETYILGSIKMHTLETPSNASSPTYTPESISQSGYSSKNPKALGWYERDGSTTAYRLTWDTSPVSGKTYYSIS